MKLGFKLLHNTNDNIKRSKLFLHLYLLGTTASLDLISPNSLSFKIPSLYSNSLVISKFLYLTKVLRSKQLFSLHNSALFNVFFFINIKKNVLNLYKSVKSYNSLNNNFKFFIYSLYSANSQLFYNSISYSDLYNNSSNNYFSYPSLDDKSSCFIYNILFKANFDISSSSKKFENINFSYLRSNKKKRFKKKQSEKLAALRENLDVISPKSIRLKYYYKFFDYKKLHPYWNKEAFIKKKFQYFHPGNNTSLLHFFYRYRKNKSLVNKHSLFSKKVSINFLLQAKIKNFRFYSHKFVNKKQKGGFKLKSFFLKSLINKNLIFNKKNTSGYLRNYSLKSFSTYNKNLISIISKSSIPSNLSFKFLNSSTFYKSNLSFLLNSNTNNMGYSNINNALINKALIKYKDFSSKNSFGYPNTIYVGNKKIKNFKANSRTPTLYRYSPSSNKRRKPYLFLNNFYSDYQKKRAFYSLSKRSKFFRTKVKYWNWLNKQKALKAWKFNKFLIFDNLLNSNFKKNILFLNSKKCNLKRKKKGILYKSDILFGPGVGYRYKASQKVANWISHDLNIYNKLKYKNFRYFFKSINYICNKYERNYSFYHSNRSLNKSYAYKNLFKGFKVFKKKNSLHFFLYKLSFKLFKKSWRHLITSYSLNKKKKPYSFLNKVPAFNQFFIKKVLNLYKSSLFSILINSNLVNSKKISFLQSKKYFKLSKNQVFLDYRKSLFLNNIDLDMLSRIKHSRLIDKTYGFNKRKEKQLKTHLKTLKLNKRLFKNKTSFLLKNISIIDNKSISRSILKKSFNKEISSLNKKISIISLKLNSAFSSKKSFSLQSRLSSSYGFKYDKFKSKSFYNYLQSIKLSPSKNSFDSFFKSLSFNNSSYLSSWVYLSSFKGKRKFYSKKLKQITNLNIKFKKQIFSLSHFYNFLKLSKLKKKNILYNNWCLNNLLKKNYNSYIKIFKYFNLYKKADTLDYFWGFGKLWNYSNVNNSNIFSFFNFLNYNFLNFKNNISLSNDYTTNFKYSSTYKSLKSLVLSNLSSIKSLFPLDDNDKLEELQLRCSTPISELYPLYDTIKKNHISSVLNYDILNKTTFFSRVLYSKNFIVKYSSVFNNNLLPFLFKVVNKKSKNIIKYSLTSRYISNDISNRNFIYNSLNSESYTTNIILLNNFIRPLPLNSALINNTDIPFKKLYYGILKSYDKVFI